MLAADYFQGAARINFIRKFGYDIAEAPFLNRIFLHLLKCGSVFYDLSICFKFTLFVRIKRCVDSPKLNKLVTLYMTFNKSCTGPFVFKQGKLFRFF